jgi:hypothetical protein
MKKYTFKKESLSEYLARGGTVTKVPPVQPKSSGLTARAKGGGAATIMSWEEGNLFFGDKQTKKRSKKVDQKEVDKLLTFLPEDVRRKIGL